MQLSRDSADWPHHSRDQQEQAVLLIERPQGLVARRHQLRLASALTLPRRSGSAHVFPWFRRRIVHGGLIQCSGQVVSEPVSVPESKWKVRHSTTVGEYVSLSINRTDDSGMMLFLPSFPWGLQDPWADLLAHTKHSVCQGSSKGQIWNKQALCWLYQQGGCSATSSWMGYDGCSCKEAVS